MPAMPANTLDLASFPTMAKYDMRPDQEIDFKSAVESAKDEHEHLLAFVEQQCRIAEKKFRSGTAIKQAIGILRRAYQVADAGAGKQGLKDVPGPARGMAKGLVRLHLCCLLSVDGRHAEALAEARAAKREMDEVWKVMTSATMEAEEAWDAGDMSRPAKHFRTMIKSPPSWTAQMVELSIQVRQALALELEFVHAPRPAQKASGPGLLREDAAGEREAEREEEELCVGEGHAPVPKMTIAEEIENLHREAAQYGTQLLPEGNPVRARAEKGMREHGKRIEEFLARKAERAQKLADWKEINQPFAEMASTDGFRKPNLSTSFMSQASTALPGSDSLNSSVMDSSYNHMGASSPNLMNMSVMSSASVSSLNSLGKLTITRGDLFTYSSVDLANHNRRLATAKALKSSNKRSPRSVESPESPGRGRGVDVFTTWKKATVDTGPLTLNQLKTKTDQGQREMQTELKMEKRRFQQVDMKFLEGADKLYDNRVHFSGYGIYCTEKAERKKAAWRDQAWAPSDSFLKRKEVTKKNFQHYGINFATSEPSLRDYAKLMHESLERNPGMIEQKKWEAAQEAKAAAERKRREEAARLEVLKSKLSGMSLGKAGSGQNIFSFAL